MNDDQPPKKPEFPKMRLLSEGGEQLFPAPGQSIRAGVKTTEFWVTVTVIALNGVLAYTGKFPADQAVSNSMLLALTWLGARSLLKK